MEKWSGIEVILDYCSIRLRSDEVLQVVVYEGAAIGFAQAKKIMDTIEQLSHFTTRSIIFDSREAGSIDLAARLFLTGERSAAYKQSMALLVPTHIEKLVANFSFAFNKPSYPVRAFLTEEEALKWSRKNYSGDLFFIQSELALSKCG
jgi:hypothetical protein